MGYTKKSFSKERRDKHFRFSIRKFNVGVASVAVAAFWMVSGGTVASNEIGVSETTAEVALGVEVPVTETPETKEEPVGPSRIAAVTYRVQYINAETGALEKQENYSAAEQTTASVADGHTFQVSVPLSTPTGFVAVSATNKAGQELAIVNNAIVAAIVEKDSSSRTIKVTVRQDDKTASNNSQEEGYTALRAATNPSTSATVNIVSPGNAESVDYAVSGAWEYSNPLPYEKDEKNFVSTPTEYENIYSTATAVIPRKNSSDVTVTVTVSDLENQTAENVNRVQIQQANQNQASYGGTSDHFELMDDPSAVPALDIRVRANRLTADQNPNDKFNFNGEYDSGYITIEFSEPVINPIIDLSGLGGNVMGTGRDHPNDPNTAFVRGSFNSTAWEYLGDEVLELSAGAENLQINGNRVEVINRNTTARVQESPSRIGTTSVNLGNFGTSAGTGSVKVVGTVTSLTFKLIHQATPVSEFAYLDGANTELILRNDGLGGTDGINGLDRDMNDDGHYYTYQSDGKPGMLSNINADLFRFSLRLPTGYVLVNYVDTEGKALQTQYTDFNKGTAEGTKYNTADDKTEKPDTIGSGNETYYLVPAGNYTVGTVGENSELTETTTELGTDAVAGEVILGKKEVTYVYQKGGDVQVHYYQLDEDGNRTEIPLSGAATGASKATVGATEEDTAYSKPGTAYNTSEDLKPTTITDSEGNVWELVSNLTDGYSVTGGVRNDENPGEAGTVAADTTKHINYYYKKVNTPKTGDVVIHYVDLDGKPIAADKVDSDDKPVGEGYNTTEEGEKPAELTGTDGTKYFLTEKTEMSEVAGKTPIADGVKQVESTEGTGADTVKNTATTNGETAKVVEGTTHVTYVYEKGGDVVVNYFQVDENGNRTAIKLSGDAEGAGKATVAEREEDTPYSKPGTEYNTSADLKPTTITDANGDKWELVSSLTDGDAEEGTVEAGKTKEINYYYKKVVKTGDVVIHYVDLDGKPIAADKVDSDDKPVGEGYNTTEEGEKPAELTGTDGTKYFLTEKTEMSEVAGKTPIADGVKQVESTEGTGADTVKNTATTNGETAKVVEGTTHVTYVYEKGGDVVVNYFQVDENGNRTAIKLSGDAEGAGKATVAEREEDTPYGKPGTEYNTSADLKPTTITDANGDKWELVSSLTDGDAEEGTVEAGKTKEINYYYKKVVKTGEVVARYVIEGTETELKDPSTVKASTTPVDEPYGDTPPATIEKDGKVYELVRTRTKEGDAPSNGTVVEGKQTITYEYKLKDNSRPTTPVTPTPERPVQPVTLTPEKPVEPAKPMLPNTGDKISLIPMVGSLLLASSLVLFGRRRKED